MSKLDRSVSACIPPIPPAASVEGLLLSRALLYLVKKVAGKHLTSRHKFRLSPNQLIKLVLGTGYRRQTYRNSMGLIRGLLIFSVGVYAGMYAAQNYNVPKVDEPQQYFNQLTEYLEQYKKKPPSS